MKTSLIRYLLPILIIFAGVFVSSCSFDSSSEPLSVTDKPGNPSPAVNAINQGLALTLSWEANSTLKFDVYLDTQSPPSRLYARDLQARSLDVFFLSPNTKYYWKVVSKLSNSQVESDVWNFTTGSTINPSIEGQILIKHRIEASKPCDVNMIFQVLDFAGNGVGGLNKGDFELREDELPIYVSESDVTINKKADVFDTLKVVLMLDNSTSLTQNIQQIRQVAAELVYNLANTVVDGVKLNVEISVYQFSEKVEMLCDFLKNKDQLYGVVWDHYALGKPTTDLYGAVVTGASRWTNVMTAQKIRQGLLILFTDGTDTQGSRTIAEALSAVYNKKVFTVGLGNEIEPNILSSLGTAGYFQITDISELRSKFDDIQREILSYVNSFYVLKYISPKRGYVDHKLKLSIRNNLNTGPGSFIEGYYNSYGFYSY